MASRVRGQRGTVVVEVVWLSILLLVPLVYVVLAVLEVQRGAFAVTAAARSAGRAFVLAPDVATANARAHLAGDVALADQGVEAGEADVVVACRPACLVAGSTAQVLVRTQVPLPLLPRVLGGQAPSIRVEATHTVPYGSFREDR